LLTTTLSLSLSFKVTTSSAQIIMLSLRDGKVPVFLNRKHELMEEEVLNILAYKLITLQ
jgi:hypothetical protein